MLYFKSALGKVIEGTDTGVVSFSTEEIWYAIYRDILPSRGRLGAVTINTELANLCKAGPWAIFLCNGGHFASAIIQRGQVLAHACFHRYVVRAKRGTTQSAHDNKGSMAKSAGATLRRYNEAALISDIHQLLMKWKSQLDVCELIFLKTPVVSRYHFFGKPKDGLLVKEDARIRSFPFVTGTWG